MLSPSSASRIYIKKNIDQISNLHQYFFKSNFSPKPKMPISDFFHKLITSLIPTENMIWSSIDDHKETLVLISFLLFLFFWYMSWILIFSPSNKKPNLRLPPGPRGLPIVGNLPFLDPELHTYFAELTQTYGPIFKLKFGNKWGVVVSSPSLAKEVLKDQDTVFANHDIPVAGLVATYGGADMVSAPYGPVWRMLRRICVREMLSNTTLDSVYLLRSREVKRTVRQIYSKIGSPIDVGEQMFITISNVITSMMWGGTLKGDETASLGGEFRKVVSEITELLAKPNISDFFPGLGWFDLQGIEKKMKRLFLRFDKIFDLIIEQRLKINLEAKNSGAGENHEDDQSSNIKDFLQFLLELKEKGGDSKLPFTMEHLKALLINMVVGGTETSSNTVEWAIAEMMNKPETMRRAQEELERIVGKDSSVEESHIPHLPYLQSVMKEVLRLHPALPLMVPRCPNLSSAVGGYLVPKGTRVFVNVWAIHRDPSIWVNPNEFDPNRFFINGQGDYSGNDFNYFPFGSGRRMCAGISMAERMVMYELGTLLHLFEWGLPDGSKLDLKEKFGIVLKKAEPLVAVPTPRFSDPALYA